MAQTKVKLISDGVIVQGNLHSSHGITTAHIGEGSNLYYTDARVDTRVGNLNTGNLPEGSNLYYTDARADARVALIVDSSPATLNTLNELAAALGDDPNFATTTATSIGTKLPLAGGTLTGTLIITGGTAYGLNITTSGTQDTININRAANNDNAITKYQTASADKWIVGLRNTGDDNFRFYSYGTSTDVLTIDQATGNVGIGETVPLKPLHVKAPDAGGNIRLTRDGTTEYHDIGTYYSYTNGNSADFGTTSAHKTFLTTRTYNALEINSDQEVSLLGYRGADGFALPQDENTGYSNFSAGGFGILFREATDNYILGNAYYYKTGGAAAWKAKHASGGTMIASNVGEITFQTATSVAAGATLTFDPKMIIKNDGKVGIGTTSPDYQLDIENTSGAAVMRLHAAANNSASLRLKNDAVDWDVNCQTNDTFAIYNHTDGTERLVILPTSGNVGIGDTTPSFPLVVSKSSSVDSNGNDASMRLALSNPDQTNNNWALITFGDGTSQPGSGFMGMQFTDHTNNYGDLVFGPRGAGGYGEKMRITSGGSTILSPSAGSKGLSMNDANQVMNSGYINGNQTISLTFTCTTMSSMFIECVFNHFGYITSYGCARVATLAVGPIIQIQNIQEITTGNGGSWTFNRVSNGEFTVAKTAGTYSGGGRWYVKINGANVYAS